MPEKHLVHEVHVLSNLISRIIDNSPPRMKIEDATGKNGWIIGYIARNPDRDIFQKDLEKQLGITRSTASKVVSLMERKGLIERKSIPGDARLKKLVLTERSFEILDQIDSEFESVENAIRVGFTEEEVDQIYGYLERMQENIKNMHAKVCSNAETNMEEGGKRE